MATTGHAARVGALFAGLVVWETASRVWHVAFVPSFAAILQALWRMLGSGEITAGLAASLGVLAAGYGLAVIVGVPAGLVMGRYRVVSDVFDPYVNALLTVPSLLLVPIVFGLFGVGRATEVAVVFLYSCVVIVVMTRSGLATIDPVYVEMARVFGASERAILKRVLLPGALPAVLTGLRLGISRAIRALINTEMLISSVGLGALLRRYGARFDAASVLGIAALVVALALLLNYGLSLAEKRVNRWAH